MIDGLSSWLRIVHATCTGQISQEIHCSRATGDRYLDQTELPGNSTSQGLVLAGHSGYCDSCVMYCPCYIDLPIPQRTLASEPPVHHGVSEQLSLSI